MADIRQFEKKEDRKRAFRLVKENEGKEEDITGYRKKFLNLLKGKKTSQIIGILLFTFVISLGFHFYDKGMIYTDYDVMTLTELTESDNMTYVAYGDYIIRYSMDGISCLDKNGVLIWGQAYELKRPIIDMCQDYVAVAGQKENAVYLFNKAGSQGSITTEYPITSISVAAQGVVAVVTENDGINYIKIYDKEGTELIRIKTSLEGNGYPFHVALSEDGKKLAVSYLDIVDNGLENSLVFYNFSDVGQNYIEQLVGGFGKNELGDVLIPDIVFLDNVTVCAFADSKLFLFKMKETPEMEETITFDKEIHSVFYNSEYIGVVLNNTEAGGLYELCVYDLAGKLKMQLQLEQDYKKISFAKNQVILYDDYSVCIYSLEGKKKFEHTFEKNIILLKQITGYRYVWVNSTSINDIRLK